MVSTSIRHLESFRSGNSFYKTNRADIFATCDMLQGSSRVVACHGLFQARPFVAGNSARSAGLDSRKTPDSIVMIQKNLQVQASPTLTLAKVYIYNL